MQFFLAAAALLLKPTNAQQLPTSRGRLRVLSDATSTHSNGQAAHLPAMESSSMSMMGIAASAKGSGSGIASGKSGKSVKSGKSAKLRSLTGIYRAIDTEDGTPQNLSIFCNEGVCDVTLKDARFSTCDKIVPGTNGGVGIAKGIPQGSIGKFTIDLYCLEQDEIVIDFSKGPTTTLQGDIEILPEGGLRRTGPRFFYAKTTVPKIKDATSKDVDVNDKSVNINGKFRGIDLDDGSIQDLRFVCTLHSCDIELYDTSFSTCKELVGQSFYTGVGVAKNVLRDSLDNFDIDLYCMGKEDREIDYDRDPDQILTGNLVLDRDGILHRTGPGYSYLKQSPNENDDTYSVYKNITQRFYGSDTEDASTQDMTLDCQGGFCDITLGDSSFSTCIDKIPGDTYLGGLAKAGGVPQDSLHNFDLDLFCAEDYLGIDYNTTRAQLKGDLLFLQGGTVQRTGPGFKYSNIFKSGGNTLTAGSNFHSGTRDDTGGLKEIRILCQSGMCEVIIWSYIHPECARPPGLPFLNGVAFNSAVPEESLEDFEIGLFCTPPGPGSTIDYESQDPISTRKVSITPGDQRGIVHLTEDGVAYDLYEKSSE